VEILEEVDTEEEEVVHVEVLEEAEEQDLYL
jgi:hypothetical protein